MILQYQCLCNNGILQPEPREVDATKFVSEFRAAPLECNAGQYEVELLLTLFHKSYIWCVK